MRITTTRLDESSDHDIDFEIPLHIPKRAYKQGRRQFELHFGWTMRSWGLAVGFDWYGGDTQTERLLHVYFGPLYLCLVWWR